MDLDDLAGSTQSTMKLLSEVLKYKIPVNSEKTLPLKELVPRLFPFLHHSSSGVRRSALHTLESLTSRYLIIIYFYDLFFYRVFHLRMCFLKRLKMSENQYVDTKIRQ